MRLREPLAGYRLSSGHYIFHIVYFLGSIHAWCTVLGRPLLGGQDASSKGERATQADMGAQGLAADSDYVFSLLMLAHLLIPLLTWVAKALKRQGCNITEKIIELSIICVYQTTILNAQ